MHVLAVWSDDPCDERIPAEYFAILAFKGGDPRVGPLIFSTAHNGCGWYLLGQDWETLRWYRDSAANAALIGAESRR